MYSNSNSTMSAVGIHIETLHETLKNWDEISVEETKSNWIGLIESKSEDLLIENVG